MNRTNQLVLGLILAIGPFVNGVSQEHQPGLNSDLQMVHDDRVRTYDLYIPSGPMDGRALPLVLDLHGTFASGDQERADSGLDALADENGFFAVWPDSLGVEWVSFPRFGPDGVDDVGFLRSLVDEVASRVPVDRTRVYVMGQSNGAAMAQRLACDAADRFAAFAAFAAATPIGDLTGCGSLRPVPMFTVRSTTDQLLPFEGGMTALVAGNQFTVRSAEAEREWWRELAGCSGPAPDVLTEPGPTTRCSRYSSCDAGVEVAMCEVVSTGAFGHVVFDNQDDIDMAREAWRFMSQFEAPRELAEPFSIDRLVEGDWTSPQSANQGLMMDFIEEAGVLFVAWFTFTEQPIAPAEMAPMEIGAAGQRWLVASLEVSGTRASGEIVAPQGGAFEMPLTEFQSSPIVGSMEIEFLGCDRAVVNYDLDRAGLSGSFEIEPIDAVVLPPEQFDCQPRATDDSQ